MGTGNALKYYFNEVVSLTVIGRGELLIAKPEVMTL